MNKYLALILITIQSFKPLDGEDKDIFTDYCKPGLCQYFGGDGMHSGCRNGILHNGVSFFKNATKC